MSLAYAVVTDVTVHSERGRFLAPMLTATNLGPCAGPVIGGAGGAGVGGSEVGVYAARAAGPCELCTGGAGAAAMGPRVEGRAGWEAVGAAGSLSPPLGVRSMMSVAGRV